MRVLFVVSQIILSEPLGVMQLSAMARRDGVQTKMISLARDSLVRTFNNFGPDLVAYNTLSPDAETFLLADRQLRKMMRRRGLNVPRIMGGAHPTYFPDVLRLADLDAICIGEGDHAFAAILARMRTGTTDFSGIANIATRSVPNPELQRVVDLDALPFVDRQLLYDAAPRYQEIGLRSLGTSRGCPYHCSYCFNSAANRKFRRCGPLLRRRSVDSVLAEIEEIRRCFPPVRFLRFADDTFAHCVDDWLLEFCRRCRREVGLPFYCLMRSNTLTREMARLLAEAGCHSLGMAVETGLSEVRNQILQRGISEKTLRESFENACEFGLNTYSNTMFAIPGTSFADDVASYHYTRNLGLAVPTFGIFCPYPRTPLTQYAVRQGLLDPDHGFSVNFGSRSLLRGYSEREKVMQVRLAHLGAIFCYLPDALLPLLKLLLRLPFDRLYSPAGTLFNRFLLAWKIFPGIRLIRRRILWQTLKDLISYQAERTKRRSSRD